MAPKQAISKKNKEKKKNQAIDDATFGLKNKNKSAKVQKFVSQVSTTLNNNLSDAVWSALEHIECSDRTPLIFLRMQYNVLIRKRRD